MRGRLVSRLAGEVLREAERLANAGVRELLIISQDTSAYGVDLKYPLDFWRDGMVSTDLQGLAGALSDLGIWIRLHYVYPYPHVDRIIPLMAERRILPYLDVPFQHGSPRILKRMKRPAAAENTLERIRSWRNICPDLTLRSTFIVGFPGETEQDFEELLDFLREAKLDRVGCFRYSDVEGARANALPGAVPEAIKHEREARFMEVQAEISRQKLQQKIGTEQEVLVDAVAADGAVGRGWSDAPEIDGVVYLPEASHLSPGDLVMARIEAADEHDLEGRLVE
jgi:ribosomal protein S12 methylthiotransferase